MDPIRTIKAIIVFLNGASLEFPVDGNTEEREMISRINQAMAKEHGLVFVSAGRTRIIGPNVMKNGLLILVPTHEIERPVPPAIIKH